MLALPRIATPYLRTFLPALVRTFTSNAPRHYQLPPRPEVDESEIKEMFLKGR
jgi:hypothetical protein